MKRKSEVALVDAEQNKAIREKYLKTDNVIIFSDILPIIVSLL